MQMNDTEPKMIKNEVMGRTALRRISGTWDQSVSTLSLRFGHSVCMALLSLVGPQSQLDSPKGKEGL